MNKSIISICALSCLLLVGCENGEERQPSSETLEGETLATVDGERIPEALLHAFARQFPNVDLDSMDSDQREQLADHVINLHILAREAERRGMDNEADVVAELILERQQTLAQALIESEAVSEEAIQQVYEERYDEALEVNARHILVEDETLAQEIIDRIQNGEDFAELAEEYSQDQGGVDGGSLGWFSPQQMVPPFAEAVSNMEAGELTDTPVETNFGWHVIRVDDTRVERPPLADVREEIVENLRQENTQRVITELREQVDVER
ncbi:peptidyl-prolyl cis-trans isomerase C [Natronospira proteinivora]|uniref:peptidylprolyl isomerase n=1 Tax=Natronospira proteinivora TaxID=1807133 RepID=A0ABT1GAK0_9GAMM|nr:peptidylprolyl isomerase [Natronospira proteinivora]MCP1726952.1 peptidyl-prolyl cis-trans isomerase C [Natronospira proteinivora]